MLKPLISVIITNYNSNKFLERSIKSVLNQSYQNFELIIIDDCSTDNSFINVKKNFNKSKKIKFFSTRSNSGTASKPRNLGILKSNGKFLAFLDADDFWLKDKLLYQVNSLDNNTLISSTASTYVSSNMKKKSNFFLDYLRILIQIFVIKKIENSGSHWFYIYNPIILSSALISKKFLNNIPFDENLNLVGIEDLNLWINLKDKFKKKKIVFIKNKLVKITRQKSFKSLTSHYSLSIVRILNCISEDFIKKKKYSFFNFFIVGLILKIIRTVLHKSSLFIKTSVIKITIAIIFIYVAIYNSPLIPTIGKKLLTYDTIKKSEAIVIFSGYGNINYFNNSYQNRYYDTINVLEKYPNYKPEIFILGRLQQIPEQKILESLFVNYGYPREKINIIYEEFSNTEENIQQVIEILDKKNIKSIIFISNPYLSKRSKLVWKKNANSLKIFVKKTVDWPKERNFFEKVYDKKTILYETLAIIYYKLSGKI